MRSVHLGAAGALVVAGLLACASSSRAGAFTQAIGCDTLSVEPFRVRQMFWIVDGHFATMCQVRIRRFSGASFLSCSAPSPLTCEIDSTTGAAVYNASPCLDPGWPSFELWVVTDAPDTCYGATLFDNYGAYDGELLCIPCEAPTTAVSDRALERFALAQNSPNPFSSKTTIRFNLPHPARVILDVLDSQGRRVGRLVNGQFPPGSHAVDWDGKSLAGERVKPGLYVYRIEAGPFRDQKKLVVLPP